MAQVLEARDDLLTDYKVNEISTSLQTIRADLKVIKGLAQLIRLQIEQPLVDSDVKLLLRKAAEIDDSLRRIDGLIHW